MVKVAENKIVDLDVFPDTRVQELAKKAREAAASGNPQEAEELTANAQNLATTLAGTVGGAGKGLVDTVGNTVGTLGEGVGGTVQGVGDGLGATVQGLGGIVGSGAGKVGGLFAGKGAEPERVQGTAQEGLEKGEEHGSAAADITGEVREAAKGVAGEMGETGETTEDGLKDAEDTLQSAGDRIGLKE